MKAAENLCRSAMLTHGPPNLRPLGSLNCPTEHDRRSLMKQIIAPLLCLLSLAPALSRADTPLTITSSSPYGCLQNAFINPTPPQITGNFTLNGVTGTGTIKSSVPASAPTFSYPP